MFEFTSCCGVCSSAHLFCHPSLQSLDIQYTVGLATNVPTTFISVVDQNQDGVNGFMDIITALLQLDNPPPVLTTSFGADEPVFEQAPEIAQ